MNSVLLLGMPGGWEFLIILFVFIIPGIFWLWAIIDLVKSEFKDSTTKLIWVLMIMFVPLFGAILYLVLGRTQKVY